MERPRYRTAQEQEEALKRQEAALQAPLTPEEIQQRIQDYAISKAQENVPLVLDEPASLGIDNRALTREAENALMSTPIIDKKTGKPAISEVPQEDISAIEDQSISVEEPLQEEQPLPEGVVPETPPKPDLPMERATEQDLSKPQEIAPEVKKPLSREELYKQLQEKYASQREQDAADLKAAQESRDVGQLIANVGEGFANIATGGKADSGFYQGLKKQAEQPIADIEARRKQMAENLGVDEKLMNITDKMVSQAREDELDDPNNPRLKQLNSLVEIQLSKTNPELLKDLKERGSFPPKTMRAYKEFTEQSDKLWEQQFKMKSLESMEEAKKATREQTQAWRDLMFNQKQNEEKRRVSKLINDEAQRLGRGDKIINKVREQSQTFDEVVPLLKASEQGNEAAIAALGTKMARSMGEVGVLTDADVTRYLGNTSYARQISSWLNRKFEGELPKGQIDDMRKVVNMLQGVYQNKLMKNYNNAASILMSRSKKLGDPVTEEEAHEILGTPGRTELDKLRKQEIMKQAAKDYGLKIDNLNNQSDKVKVINSKGEKGLIPKSQLDKALKQGYKVAE